MHPKPPNNVVEIPNKPDFRKYLEYIRSNNRETVIAVIFYLLAGITIYICYPYPDIMQDSGSYLNFVYPNISYGGPRPLGYSILLLVLRGIYGGTGIIFIVQYLFFCLSCFFFYSTTVYLFAIRDRSIRYAYFAFSLLFISGMYASNMIMSDSIFSSLSLLLLTCCLWLLHTPERRLLVPVVLLTTIIITVRYIGMVYPILVIPVLFLSFKAKKLPVIASLCMVFFIYIYVKTVKEGTLNDQGVEVFSGFSGWQLANNALHVIPHTDLNIPLVESWEDSSLVFIDYVVRKSYIQNKHLYPAPDEVGYPFIWTDSLPLRIVFNTYRGNTPAKNRNKYYTDWNNAGKTYSEYGMRLMRTYLPEYLRYYIANNIARTLHPPIEIFDSYNQMKDTHILKLFYGWDDDRKFKPRHDVFRPVLTHLSWIYTFYWCLFGLSLVMLITTMGFKKMAYKPENNKLIYVLVLFIILYTAANIYAAPVNLRFLIPVRPVIIALFFIILHYIAVKARREKTHTEPGTTHS